jgi:uncharacterized protein
MKLLSVLVASCLLVSGAAFAQAAGDAAAQKAAVADLMDAVNFKQSVSQMAKSMSQSMPQMVEQMVGNNPKLSPAEQAKAKGMAAAESQKMSNALLDVYNDPEVIKSMEDMMSTAYARHFTGEEMKALTTFYRSPVGKKSLNVMPTIMQESMPLVANIIAPRMNKLMQKTAADIVAQVSKSEKRTDKTEPVKGEPRKEKTTAAN